MTIPIFFYTKAFYFEVDFITTVFRISTAETWWNNKSYQKVGRLQAIGQYTVKPLAGINKIMTIRTNNAKDVLDFGIFWGDTF